jgi:hypothetical protein
VELRLSYKQGIWHSNKFVATGIKPEPKVFSLFPEARRWLLSFAAANLDSFCIEKVQSYFTMTLFPELFDEYTDMAVEAGDEQDDLLHYEDFLKYELGISEDGISVSTVCLYLNYLNYKYDVHKKTHYVDGHEQDDVVQGQVSHVIQYIKSTLQCYEWVQVSKDELQALHDKMKVQDKKFKFDTKCAYSYNGDECVEMSEFHVDTTKELCDYVSEHSKQFGGNLSVRKKLEDKLLIRIGQDEALFHKNQLGQKSWILSDGRMHINPKTDGDTRMASVFNNRVFSVEWRMHALIGIK